MEVVLCSDCFEDPGLRMDAQGFDVAVEGTCPVCRSGKGKKIDKERVAALAGSFFVRGTMLRCDYGAAPVVQFNEHQKTSIGAPPWLEPEADFTADLKKIDVPTLVLHGDDDQIVPIDTSAHLSSKLIKGATLKVFPGAPHGLCSTHKDQVNGELLALFKL